MEFLANGIQDQSETGIARTSMAAINLVPQWIYGSTTPIYNWSQYGTTVLWNTTYGLTAAPAQPNQSESDAQWLRRRVKEITDLAPTA